MPDPSPDTAAATFDADRARTRLGWAMENPTAHSVSADDFLAALDALDTARATVDRLTRENIELRKLGPRFRAERERDEARAEVEERDRRLAAVMRRRAPKTWAARDRYSDGWNDAMTAVRAAASVPAEGETT